MDSKSLTLQAQMALEISVNEADLDHLLTELRVLKRAGSQVEDSRQIWCSDWLKYVKVILPIFLVLLTIRSRRVV